MRLKRIFLIINLIFITSCGYEVLNNTTNFNFKIKNIEITGDNKINKRIEKNFLKFEENMQANRYFDFKLNSAINKNVTSKDTQGRDSSFSIELIVSIEIIENNKIIKKAKIKKNTNYNNLNSQFELKRYENILIKDLTDQIIIDLNNLMRTL